VSPVLATVFAPLLATAVVLLLEGTPLLAVDPIRGLTLAFLPLSFAIGLTSRGFLAIAARLPKLFETDPEETDRERTPPARSPAVEHPSAPRQEHLMSQRPARERRLEPPSSPPVTLLQSESLSSNGAAARSEVELDDGRAPLPSAEEPTSKYGRRAVSEVPFFRKRKSSPPENG
jgi:hypothetical protein